MIFSGCFLFTPVRDGEETICLNIASVLTQHGRRASGSGQRRLWESDQTNGGDASREYPRVDFLPSRLPVLCGSLPIFRHAELMQQ
jgi:hypothetical protein